MKTFFFLDAEAYDMQVKLARCNTEKKPRQFFFSTELSSKFPRERPKSSSLNKSLVELCYRYWYRWSGRGEFRTPIFQAPPPGLYLGISRHKSAHSKDGN